MIPLISRFECIKEKMTGSCFGTRTEPVRFSLAFVAQKVASVRKKYRKMSILDVITKQRRVDVADAKQRVSEQQLREKIRATERTFGSALNVLDRLNAPVVSRK